MSTTINGAAGFDTVPNHVALTVSASWRHRLNRTFEAVECQGLARLRDLKGLVVVVARRHRKLPCDAPFLGPDRLSPIIQAAISLWPERDS
jgi:hypothetical protein